MEFSDPSLRRYRSDRRKLLEFLLSSGLIKEIRAPGGPQPSINDVNFDSISADYVIECVQSGGMFDVSQATERYYEESAYPLARHLRSGDVYYLQTDPNAAGSPPNRVPPPINLNGGDFLESRDSEQANLLAGERPPLSRHYTGTSCQVSATPDTNSLLSTSILSVGLPNLRTGLLDDDLRESAYEVFLACMLFSGVEIHPTEGRKREKSSKFLSGLNRRAKRHIEPEFPERHLKVLDTFRIQMQISEATDTFIRRRLAQFSAGKSYSHTDVPQLSLMLLTGVLRSDFPSEKSYLHWKNRQACVFQELVSPDKNAEKQIVGALARIRNSEEWDVKMSPSERSDILLTLERVALAISSIPGRFGLEGETWYWTSGYQLNIRLYKKLLFGLFDVLEDSKLVEESEEILKLVKLTWSMLGITERLHHALFSWVLFIQFLATQEAALFDYAICEIGKVLSVEVSDDKEVAYMKSLMCLTTGNSCEIRLNLLQSIFLSMSSWCDSKLQDYHLHFSQFTGSGFPNEIVTEKIRTYVEKSLYAACERATVLTTSSCIKNKMHQLVVLASELRLVSEKDLSVFTPVLRNWFPQCAVISAKMLHQFYGKKLKPFLKDAPSLPEDARKVLPAAYALENCIIELYSSACEESHSYPGREFERYRINEISRPIILDWAVSQHEKILEWTGRAFDIEDWEPLSFHQKQAASAVEVFRIIEETVEQFFEWRLPMDITHLQALLSIIFHSLDSYLLKVVIQLVEKQNLYPSTPPLTRYKEATFPIVKKKVAETLMIDDGMYKQLDELTVSKLCIRLNTYRYIQKQTAALEDGIRKSWESVVSYQMDRHSTDRSPDILDRKDLNGESISELFIATLDCIKDSAAQAIRKTSDFLGAKIVFWDMRDSFLFYLYHGGVEGNRIDRVLPKFDSVLNNICGLIDDTIRDLVVSSLWKASLEGFRWLLLDGGPSRAFSETDIAMIEEDLDMLKDLFVADGEGLPRSLVVEEAQSCHQILGLFSLQTEFLTHMLMASSEHISVRVSSYKNGQQYLGDAHTLIRVLCHKKDREASKFLKRHYQLPPSSEYEETRVENSSSSSPLIADLLKRSTSFRWSETGHNSFRSIKKKFQQATWR